MGDDMRIAVSADDGNGLDGVVSPHFGRCPFFVMVDVDDCEVLDVSVIENPFYGRHQPGQVPKFIKGHGADVMLTGGMGRRAIGFFERFGIQAVTGASGSLRHSLERYLGGELKGAEPCRDSVQHAHQHAGAPGEAESQGVDEATYEKDAVGRLREEADMLQEQLNDVMTRLRDFGAEA